MELPSLNNLDQQVTRFLDKYHSMKTERDEFAERVARLEAEIAELHRAKDELDKEIVEVRQNVRDKEKEERIKSKVDELLAKLEGF
ncbi:MAG: hypothetical protein P9X24_09290 [Candidatus Hatepunaea meridiana]|nr:hypothetical protein [Candidatus Hatepunaea meridiana]